VSAPTTPGTVPPVAVPGHTPGSAITPPVALPGTLFDSRDLREPSTAAGMGGDPLPAADGRPLPITTGQGPAVTFTVYGTPIAQGSKRIGRHGPHPVILDSNDKVLRPWRDGPWAQANIAALWLCNYDNVPDPPRQEPV